MARRKLRTLLIANRGEIALRIIRSAQTMGLKTAAVYSEPDRNSPHVFAADEAVAIGPAEAAQSYLKIEAILEAAQKCHADAIHPGYGFLSERPEFARAVEAAGLIFVGPPADVMAALGDKVAARTIAQGAGVPVVPGIDSTEVSSIRQFAARSGYPMLIKAAAGGGGRGMRVAESEKDLVPALEAGAREAAAAFGDGRVFVEKYLARPRHIEVQVLGDSHGNVIALGERDCSIQRRHQKVIEESPAPALDTSIRSALLEAAIRMAKSAHYRGAGTVEFLVQGGNFYFLEVNARLQVEHPVTEMRFDCDLVAEQLRIADGDRVGEPRKPVGYAIECRINAEDAAAGFRPATGAVLDVSIPGGPGIRFDSWLARGVEVTSYYDSLLGKLIAHGATREQARNRMLIALGEFSLLGVVTTAAFLRDIIASAQFRNADLSTRFIEEFFPKWTLPQAGDLADAVLIAAALATRQERGGYPGSNGGSSVRSGTFELRSPWAELAGFELWRRR